jgi:thiol-disulfide isomerase/thioredoxin
MGERAKKQMTFLTALQTLMPGKPAPDIENQDLDGKTFKLRDYRGKVVMLSFWASWCPPCMKLVPQERELVKQMGGKPFVLIGVNGDDDRAKLKEVVAKNEIGWRSFWNGEKGPSGPIAEAWCVRGWPTVYLIDYKGVIRKRYAGSPEKSMWDPEIERLVMEAEKVRPDK